MRDEPRPAHAARPAHQRLRAPRNAAYQFTSTFIYGSWDGHVTFNEPMVTLAYLQSPPDSVGTIAVPAAFAQSGYHPSAYRVTYDAQANEYRVGPVGLEEN